MVYTGIKYIDIDLVYSRIKKNVNTGPVYASVKKLDVRLDGTSVQLVDIYLVYTRIKKVVVNPVYMSRKDKYKPSLRLSQNM